MLLLGQGDEFDIVITELGGTVGDIESLPYIEAVRQLRWELGANDTVVIHLTLIPYLSAAKELKTKPTQHSVKELLKEGVQPDILVCRTEHPLTKDIRKKLALFCNVNENGVIQALDCPTIYDVPLEMQKENLDKIVLSRLKLAARQEPELENWKAFLTKLKNPTGKVKIGLVGKYVELQDAYKSIIESFTHAGAINETEIVLESIQSENITEENAEKKLSGLDGVLVAPGFGERGIEGKIAAIKYVRENNIPFFGICLGMQCAVIEFARNVLGYTGAHSYEFNNMASHLVITLMEEQKKVVNKGGTMRLGAYPCKVKNGSKAKEIYGTGVVHERHRHRYEFNNIFLGEYEENGMLASGINPDSGLVEIMENIHHPFFIGVQFHPELKSTVENPHPLFVSFIKAAIEHKNGALQSPVSTRKSEVNSV
jgi:CTP synthase